MTAGLVTVLGGDGFVGRYAVQALLAAGWRVRIASRTPRRGWHLKALANLGQIAWIAADVTRPESLVRACAGADAIVNLVGSFDQMDAVQATGAGNVAQAASRAGAGHLVHISAIGADAASASTYGRTKGAGETAVRAAFPGAAILRPSIIFGREDKFVNRFAALIRMLPLVPVIGGAARLQPVYVGDVARAITAALEGRRSGTFELGGPQVLTMAELNAWIAKASGRDARFIAIPDAVSRMIATLTGWLPGAPITRDQWLMLQSPNVVGEGAQGLGDLGISATPFSAVVPGWLVQYRRHGRFGVAA